MSIAAIFTAAWWAQKLRGPSLQALVIAVSVLAVVVVAGLGLHWLREDARNDEAMSWRARLATAKAAAESEMNSRMHAAERIGATRQAERERRHAEEKRQLEELLEATKDLAATNAAQSQKAAPAPAAAPRGCYGPELIRRLNKL